jgi:hypothetical protein
MTNEQRSEDKDLFQRSNDENKMRRVIIIGSAVVIFITLISIGVFAGLRIFGDATPTENPLPQQLEDEYTKLRATATAACARFMDQFPGTPCPPLEDSKFIESATQACTTFQEQFPGTPCPK